jgi:hypothetical protein
LSTPIYLALNSAKLPALAGAMTGQHKAQGKAGTWPGTTGIAAPWLRPFPGLAGPLAVRLREWAAAEVAPGRLMPWLPQRKLRTSANV